MRSSFSAGIAQNEWMEVRESLFAPLTLTPSFGAMHTGNLDRVTVFSFIIPYSLSPWAFLQALIGCLIASNVMFTLYTT